MQRMDSQTNIVRRSIEVASVRIELIRRGLTVRQLATLCGVTRMGLDAEMSRGVPASQMRCRIERALGKVFWSSQAEFDRRTRVFDALGVDFGFDSLCKLTEAAQRAGIDLAGARKPKGSAVHRIEEFLAANPKFTTTTTPSPQSRP